MENNATNSPNKSRLFYCIMSAVIGFLLGEFWPKAAELWIEGFGTDTEKTVQEYRTMKVESEEDLTRQEALFWKAERDSILRAEKAKVDSILRVEKAERDSLNRFLAREATQCIRREIERGKKDPCNSSVYYLRGILARGTNWRIKSTECNDQFSIPAYRGDIPVSLLDRTWLKRYLAYRPRVTEPDIARIHGICE